MLSFTVGDRVFKIPQDRLPPTSMLYTLSQTKIGKTIIDESIVVSEDNDDIKSFEYVMEYLLYDTFPPLKYIPVFDYLGLNPMNSYDIALFPEEYMRKNMYSPEFARHPMNTNPYYGLVKLTPEMWDMLELKRTNDPNLLFTHGPIQKQSWDTIQKSLEDLKPLFTDDHVVVAGGRVLSAMFGTKSSDVDIFFYGLDACDAENRIYSVVKQVGFSDEKIKEQAELRMKQVTEFRDKIYGNPVASYNINIDKLVAKVNFNQQYSQYKDIIKKLKEDFEFQACPKPLPYSFFVRTKNSFTFGPYQIILRLYRSISEVLHGFDVDCCSVGYDGKHIWMTKRALYGICNTVNTINFNRLSPSYEWRLAKYGARGFAVKIPNFDKTRVAIKKIDARFDLLVTEKNFHINGNDMLLVKKIPVPLRKGLRKKVNKTTTEPLKGLDILLYLNRDIERNNFTPRSKESVANISYEYSDYGTARKANGNDIDNILAFIEGGVYEYPEIEAKFTPLMEKLVIKEKFLLMYSISNIPIASRIEEIKCCPSRILKFSRDPIALEKLIEAVLHINSDLYEILGTIRPWDLPKDIGWKTVNPGEQMTGTFHQTVLNDISFWYNHLFYR
jgi:hypothetical protein